jgi:plastocyanin
MRFSTFLAALLPVGAALAETIQVMVGQNGTLTFSPSSVVAKEGDTISFTFLSKNHTVTQSTFASPCTNFTTADGQSGLDSGYQFVPANATQFQQYSFTMQNVNESVPLWFYCRQADHCQKGMVFAVNPTAEKSFDAFKAKAMGLSATNGSSTSAPSASQSGLVTSVRPTAASTTVPGGSSASASAINPSASAGASGAVAVKAGSAIGLLLTGVGLVAGLML